MTEQERETVESLKINIMGSVGYLSLLHDTLEKSNNLHLFPVFEDVTVKNMVQSYKTISNLRGY